MKESPVRLPSRLFFATIAILTMLGSLQVYAGTTVIISEGLSTPTSTVVSQEKDSTDIQILQKEMLLLNKDLDNTKESYKNFYEAATAQDGQLSSQISWTNGIIGIASLLLTILGVFLGFFIEKRYRAVKNMNTVMEKLKKETEDYIENNAKGFYDKLKRAETNNYLDRLVEIPEDITNLAPALLSRDLASDDFKKLKAAFRKLTLKNTRTSSHLQSIPLYIIVFIQHFFRQFLLDSEMGPMTVGLMNMEETSEVVFNKFFDVDIKKLFRELFRYIGEPNAESEIKKAIVPAVFFCYYKSEHKNTTDVVDFIKNLIKNNKTADDIVDMAKIGHEAESEYIKWLDSI